MKKKSIFIIVCLVLSMVVKLTGCNAGTSEGETSGPAAVCFAIAPTANAQGLNLNSQRIQDITYDTILNYGYISVVAIDGNPEVVHHKSYDIEEQYKKASDTKLEGDARTKASNLIAAMQNVAVNDVEVDYLAGVRTAVRSLASLEGYDSKTVIVVGTGLSTAGTLNFQNNLLSADPEDIVDQLEEKNEIPDMTGITVIWQQMGDVAEPQQELSQTQVDKLWKIWEGIVERGNGTFEPDYTMADPVKDDKQSPEVSVVKLPPETPIQYDAEDFGKGSDALKTSIVLPEGQVTFIADKAEYAHPEEVAKALKPIADYLIQYQEVNVLLVGTTAGDQDSDNTFRLSEDRAAAVRNTLIQLGVDENRIVAVGLGCSDPWHIMGAGYEGSLASKNRKVVLMDASQSLAKEILRENGYLSE